MGHIRGALGRNNQLMEVDQLVPGDGGRGGGVAGGQGAQRRLQPHAHGGPVVHQQLVYDVTCARKRDRGVSRKVLRRCQTKNTKAAQAH